MERTDLNAIMLTSIRRSLLETRLEEAKARFRENTVLYHNGGMFVVGPHMIVNWIIKSPNDHHLILDSTGLPVEIEDGPGFHEKCQRQYASALQRFHLDVLEARQKYPQDLFEECAG